MFPLPSKMLKLLLMAPEAPIAVITYILPPHVGSTAERPDVEHDSLALRFSFTIIRVGATTFT